MKKSIYLVLLICFFSMISSARQRYFNSGVGNTIDEVAKTKTSEAEAEEAEAGKGFDLSPVGFFVLNM